MSNLMLKGGLLFWSACLLSACVSAPPRAVVQGFFRDTAFKPMEEPISPQQVMAMTPAMRRYADETLRPAMARGTPERVLIDALYTQGHLQLEYDAERTRNAAEAFEARAGNCLSLIIMTAAFANYLDLPVLFQNVLTEQSWSRSEHIALANGHVNLVLARYQEDPNTLTAGYSALTVDFLPSSTAGKYRTRPISEATVMAMYMNNRAAEYLTDGQYDVAYWWARAAVQTAPRFLDSYNTLGVIYHLHGDTAAAENVLRYTLMQEPANTIAMSNLVGVLNTQGRKTEAAQWAAKLARIEPYPPFHFYDLGIAALKAGDYQAAQRWFQEELSRESDLAEANFWLGVASLQLGDWRKAQKHIQRAVDSSTTIGNRKLYSAKLDWLQSQGYRRTGS